MAQRVAANPGAVYTWQDGEHTRRVRLVPGLVVQATAANTTDDLVVSARGGRSIVQRQTRHSGDAEPVFVAESGGALMTLPGGVLLALNPEWAEERVSRFFAANGIKSHRVTEQQFAVNAFFVETDPGLASLELANALAGKAGVVISIPNWAQESVHR